MKLVVTGALGHIGSRLIRHLPSVFPGVQIVMLDNLATQRYCSLFDLKEGQYRFLEADVTMCPLGPVVQGAEAVIHLAAMTDPSESYQKKRLVHQVNVGGSLRVAQACVESGTPLVFISTTSVYGKKRSPYTLSKLKAEQLLQLQGKKAGLRFVILRFGTIFGVSPGMRFHTAVNRFCWQAAFGQPITVWRGALKQVRPYLELGDAVHAIEFVLKRRLFNGQSYNVLTTEATVSHILETLARVSPSLRVEQVSAKTQDLSSYRVPTRGFALKGFQPEGNLEAGIKEILALFSREDPSNELRPRLR